MEPGAQNLDAGTARLASLTEAQQGALEVNAPVSQEQADRHALASEVRSKVEVSPKPLGTLAEEFGVSSTPPKEVARQRASTLVSKDDGLSPQAQKEADIRSNAIQVAEVVARNIVDNGGIRFQNPDNLAMLQTSIRDLIPAITDVQLTPDQVLNFANTLIQDPEIFQEIVREYNELQRMEAPREIANALEAKTIADKAFSEAEAAKNKAEGERARLEERRISLDPDNVDYYSDNQRLIRLDGSRPQARLERGQKDYRNAEESLEGLKSRYGDTPTEAQLAEIRAAEGKANRLYDELGKIQQDVTDQASLTRERKALPVKIASNKGELEDVKRAYEEAKGNQGRADADLSLARGGRVDFETEYLSRLSNIVRNSAIKVIDARVKIINESNNVRLAQEAKNTGIKVEEDMARGLSSRYLKPVSVIERKGVVRRKTTTRDDFETDSEKARQDVEGFFKPGSTGPEAIVRETLIEALTPKDASGKPNGQPNMTDVNKYLSDPNFMSHWSTELGMHAINTHLQAKGRITDGQSRFIESQPWGKVIIQKAIESPQGAAYEAKLKEKGELPQGFKGALSTEEGKKKYLALILKIAAGTVGPGVVAVVGSAAQTAKGGH